MSNDERAEEAYEALWKDYQAKCSERDTLAQQVSHLLERPDVSPCGCGHSWHQHMVVHNDIGERGGCVECDCDLMVGVIKIGQGHSTIFKL